MVSFEVYNYQKLTDIERAPFQTSYFPAPFSDILFLSAGLGPFTQVLLMIRKAVQHKVGVD